MAEQLDMTVSGVWSRYRRARPPTHHAWAVGSRFSPTRLTRTLLSVSEQPSRIISVERPRGLSSPPHDERLTASQSSVVPACYMCQVRPGRQTRDRSYLVLAKPSVIMNDIRRRGWRFPGGSRSWQQESSGHVLDHGIEFTHRCSGRIDEMGRHDLYSA
jgi:hypothetical protein